MMNYSLNRVIYIKWLDHGHLYLISYYPPCYLGPPEQLRPLSEEGIKDISL